MMALSSKHVSTFDNQPKKIVKLMKLDVHNILKIFVL